MTNLVKVESAADRVEQAKRLIQETRLARMHPRPPAPPIEAQIEFTRRASEAAAGLAHLIDGLDADLHSAGTESPTRS
jgi:hypothetical protein